LTDNPTDDPIVVLHRYYLQATMLRRLFEQMMKQYPGPHTTSISEGFLHLLTSMNLWYGAVYALPLWAVEQEPRQDPAGISEAPRGYRTLVISPRRHDLKTDEIAERILRAESCAYAPCVEFMERGCRPMFLHRCPSTTRHCRCRRCGRSAPGSRRCHSMSPCRCHTQRSQSSRC
jgi:hypothetical protein